METARLTVVEQLNKLLEMEISGVARYLHYSFMVFGANRIHHRGFRDQANEGTRTARWSVRK